MPNADEGAVSTYATRGTQRGLRYDNRIPFASPGAGTQRGTRGLDIRKVVWRDVVLAPLLADALEWWNREAERP